LRASPAFNDKIKAMNNKNIAFDFDPRIDSKPNLKKLVNKNYLKNKKFFNKNISDIKITFLHTRSQMDKICNQKIPNWLVGYTKNKQIYIFSPSVFDKVSNHPATDFSYILTHEIAHIFSNNLLSFYYPKWLHEGIAGYVAKQYKIRKIRKIDKFSQLHDSKSWNKLVNYPQAFLFTKYLIDTLGKEKILEFLKQLPENVSRHHYPKDFFRFFKKFFKIKFNQVVFEWKKTIKINQC